jgi:hypothetical protein
VANRKSDAVRFAESNALVDTFTICFPVSYTDSISNGISNTLADAFTNCFAVSYTDSISVSFADADSKSVPIVL